MSKRIYLAYDVEATGCRVLTDEVACVGFVEGDEKGNILFKKRFSMKTNGNFEAECKSGFWDKLPKDVYEILLSGQVDQLTIWKEIATYIDSLETKYPNCEIVLLSDNPAFDNKFIDVNLERYTGRKPICYDSKRGYRSTEDAHQYYTSMPTEHKTEIKRLVNELVEHNHMPENDAAHHYYTYILSQRWWEKID
jgi:hypothetical protein